MRGTITYIMVIVGMAIFMVALTIGTQNPNDPPLAFYILSPLGLVVAFGSILVNLHLSLKEDE